jgi:ABC-type multidrug transport system fused ATPase/permease subunit
MAVQQCPLGFYCPAGSSERKNCPAAYYCPTPAEKILCPEDHYCRNNTIEPVKCRRFSYCKAGSKIPAIGGDYLFLTVLFVVLYVAGSHGYLKLLNVLKKKTQAALLDFATTPLDMLSPSKKKGRGDDEEDDDVPGLFVERKELMEFTFREMGLKLHNGKIALQGVSGEIKSHTLAAVMGPSGAGKTTFMNALCGRAHYGQVTGEGE